MSARPVGAAGRADDGAPSPAAAAAAGAALPGVAAGPEAARSDPAAPSSADGTARLFLALWPTPAVRSRLTAWRDASCTFAPGAAVVAPARLHVTLHFIGAVSRGDLPRVAQGLAVASAVVEMKFGTARLWPGGLAVLEPHGAPPGLLQLHRRLGEALERLGLPVEARAYRPHVTLARRADGATLPARGPELRWRARSHVLVESHPGASGGYEVLHRYR